MHRRTSLKQAFLMILSAATWTSGRAKVADPDAKALRVAAASDLKFVLPLLLEAFQSATGIKVEATFGSSGNFARQIRQGLPVDVFMSADESWVDQLAQAGFTRNIGNAGAAQPDRGVIYALGRLALYVPLDSSIPLDPELAGLRSSWKQVNKLAIANPEHAPYGRAARELLEKLGMWELVLPKLVLGENIAQATQFVATGAAQAGITALSLALAPEVARHGRHVALPAHLHGAMRQRMVLTRSAAPLAQRLFDYLQTEPARMLFKRYGFEA
jgi:molybdate transport system substrate-binding protein